MVTPQLQLKLIRATTADAPALAALDSRNYQQSLSAVQWQQLLTNSAVAAVVIVDSGSPIAAIVVECRGSSECDLLRLAVDSNYRRGGLGRLLVTMLGTTQLLRLRLRETNRSGLESAIAVGFRVIAVDRGGFGAVDAVILERNATSGNR